MLYAPLVIITDTDGALAAETLRPEAAKLDIGLWHARMSEQEPGAEDWLGEDVEDGVGDNLFVDVHVPEIQLAIKHCEESGVEISIPAPISDAPYTVN